MRQLFVDTSAWFSLINEADPEHRAVREALFSFPGRLLTSNFVFDETLTLCLKRLGYPVAYKVGTTLRQESFVEMVRVTSQDEDAAWRLFCQRSDKVYSFTDCTSFVLLRKLGLQEAAALDDDFAREGFRTLP